MLALYTKSKTKLRWVTQVRVAAGYHEPLGCKMENSSQSNNFKKQYMAEMDHNFAGPKLRKVSMNSPVNKWTYFFICQIIAFGFVCAFIGELIIEKEFSIPLFTAFCTIALIDFILLLKLKKEFKKGKTT